MKLPYILSLGFHVISCHAQEACDSACQTAFQAAVQLESSTWVSKNVSLDEFYSTPANSTGARPGDLLRWEDLSREVVNTKFTPPAGMSISRFLYMTEDIDRKPIPASAFVLLPYKKSDPSKPLDTVVWTHGTAGRIRNCAPSNHKGLYYEWQGPFALAQAGYAVIGPDYAGQGSDIPQGFMYEAGHLHAADVAYGLIAARKVMGDLLSEEYVVVGHSEGGMTAWRTNERLAMPQQEELLKAGSSWVQLLLLQHFGPSILFLNPSGEPMADRSVMLSRCFSCSHLRSSSPTHLNSKTMSQTPCSVVSLSWIKAAFRSEEPYSPI
jgi:hypothetical protein